MQDKRLRGIWHHMRSRCESEKNNRFYLYGARWIKVCREWQSFEAFRTWAKKSGYNDALSIDRIDTNGDYTPQNCRWATPKEQANNRRNNHIIRFQGETRTLSEWSERTGIGQTTIWMRLRRGWSIEKTLTKGARHDWHNKTDHRLAV
ncbi:MAG: hypothetical protein IKF16_12215 [Lachnospiraceae bacterium]|nr:hypothetical protein [Lachnospiraceae bacterium]